MVDVTLDGLEPQAQYGSFERNAIDLPLERPQNLRRTDPVARKRDVEHRAGRDRVTANKALGSSTGTEVDLNDFSPSTSPKSRRSSEPA